MTDALVIDCTSGDAQTIPMTAAEAAALAQAQADGQALTQAQDAADANAIALRDKARQAIANLDPAWNFAALPQATRDAQRDQLLQLLTRCVARLIRLEAQQLDQAP